MNSERWKKVKGLFDAVVGLAPSERQRFLAKFCGGDVELRGDVEKLLASSDEAKSFMEQAAVGEVAEIIVDEGKKLQIGECFNHYEILSPLGAGGMGEVYLAQDTKLDRKIALKILPQEFAEDKDRMSRFVREAKSASALNHPNIITIYEIGESNGTHYIATEFIDGKTLSEYIRSNPFNHKSTLEIAIQIASALDEAHSAGIVHRDIKPDNVMIRANGLAKILDFGIAKLSAPTTSTDQEAATAIKSGTSPGMIIGTANYMSPEQARGKAVDARTDIFSFGVVLYEIIAGHLPFEGENALEMIGAILHKEPKPLNADVSTEIAKIISKCLRKERDERYQTIKDVLIDVQDVKQDLEFQNKLERSIVPNQDENKTQILKATTLDEINQITTNQTVSNNPKTKYLAIGLAFLLLSAVGFFAYRYYTQTKQIESIAVMPFVNESGNSDVEYLSDGMTETLISSLSQLPNLNVKARSSVFRYKGKETDANTIGKELNVQAILTGRVIQRGQDLTLYITLVDAQTENVLWKQNYNKTLKNLVALQADIARDVADNLKVKLSGADERKLAKNYTTNAEAYQLYLRGRFHYSKLTPPDIETGISYLQQAIKVDPNYALAYAGLSDAYRSFAVAGDMLPTEFLPKAKAAARTAIELDETLSEAHTALGVAVFWGEWNWSFAENEYKRAIELNPKNAEAYLYYAHLLSILGRHPEAVAEVKSARELEPLNLRINALEGLFLIHAGRNDEALDRLRKAFELDPNFWLAHNFAASAYIEKGMYPEAVAEARRARNLYDGGSQPIAFEGYALGKSGKTAEARVVLEELLKSSTTRYVTPYHIALVYNGLNERDKTLDWLDRAYEQHSPRMVFLKVEPKWNNLRNEPRFQDLLRRVGLNSTTENSAGTNSKHYWQMSDAEQLSFIRESARHIQTLIGDDPTDFDEEALRAIKVEIDDYVEEKDSLSQKPFDEGLRVIYGRASQYAPLVIRAYEARQVPPALGLYQAMVESEYHDCPTNPHPTGPVGLFQFSRKTAAIYGLTEKDYCNVEKQADAAARLMSDLTSDFGSGKSSATLGLLGFYNGADGVREYLRQLRGRGITERSFWVIFRYRNDLKEPLSEAGKQYVPRFFAVAIIGETPEVFELSTPPLTTLREKGK